MANKALRLPVSELRKEGASNSALFCLPMGGRDILLSMADRLLWEIYQESDGTRVKLTDAERAIVESTIEGLLMSCEIDLSSIGDGLEAIADALGNLQQQITLNCQPDITVNCGGGDNFIIMPGPGEDPIINPGPLPINPIDETDPFPIPDDWPEEPLDPETDPPPYGDTWEQYDADACAAANALWNVVYQSCRILESQLTSTAVTLALIVVAINGIAVGGIALLFSREFIISLAKSAWRLVTAAGGEIVEEFFQELGDFLLANKEEMICFLYSNRVGGSSGINNYIAMSWNFVSGTYLYASEPSIVEGVFRLLFSEGALQTLLAAGRSYTVPSPLDCSLCQELPAYSWHGIIEGEYGTWVNNGGASITRSGIVWTHQAVGSIGYYEGEITVDVAAFLSRVEADRIVAARLTWVDVSAPGTGARIRNWPMLNASAITPASPPSGQYVVRYDNSASSAAIQFLDDEDYVYITGANFDGEPSSTSIKFRPETYTAGKSFKFTIEYLVERG